MSDESGSDSGGTGSDSSGGDSTVTSSVSTFVNGDGDITVKGLNINDDFSGEATVKITMSKNFSDIGYPETVSIDVYEFSNSSASDTGSKGETTIVDNTISFTDVDASTRDFYRIGIYDNTNDGARLGQTLYDSGFYPTKIEFNTSDNTYSYDVVKPS